MIKDEARMWLQRLAAGLSALTCVLALAAPVAARPARVVSINLCTDELLMALGTPDQIAAISTIAQDPRLSAMATDAARYRAIVGSAEEVVKLAPDLVLAGAFTRRETRDILQRFGIAVSTFDPVTDIAGAIVEVRRAASLLGNEARGQELAGRIERATEAARDSGQKLVVLPLQRRGFVSGGGTLLSDILDRTGAINAAARMGIASVAQVPTESILRAHPDALIVDDRVPEARDQGTALLLHPAIARAVPPDRWIELPVKSIICAGPTLPDAIERVARGLAAARSLTRIPERTGTR